MDWRDVVLVVVGFGTSSILVSAQRRGWRFGVGSVLLLMALVALVLLAIASDFRNWSELN